MRKKLPLIFLPTVLFFLSVKPVFAAGPHLFFNPATGNQTTAFSVEVKIDTGSKSAGAADVHIEYPKDLLRIDQVTKPTDAVFTEMIHLINNNEGKLRINAFFSSSDSGDSFKGTNGTIAKIDFTPLKSGTPEVKFTCTAGSTTESNIADKISLTDMIVCADNVSATYTLAVSGSPASSSATSTPTPTPTTARSSSGSSSGSTSSGGGSTSLATPTPVIPVSGSSFQTIGLLGMGIAILLTGLVLAF